MLAQRFHDVFQVPFGDRVEVLVMEGICFEEKADKIVIVLPSSDIEKGNTIIIF